MEKYEVIFCIVDAGFSEVVMDAAKEVGARGGTVINARGTANKEAEKIFQIIIQPDKEIVMILVPAKIKDAVLHALYHAAGLKTAGHGIAFSMAVESAVGLASPVKQSEGDAAADKQQDKPAAEKTAEKAEEKPEENHGTEDAAENNKKSK